MKKFIFIFITILLVANIPLFSYADTSISIDIEQASDVLDRLNLLYESESEVEEVTLVLKNDIEDVNFTYGRYFNLIMEGNNHILGMCYNLSRSFNDEGNIITFNNLTLKEKKGGFITSFTGTVNLRDVNITYDESNLPNMGILVNNGTLNIYSGNIPAPTGTADSIRVQRDGIVNFMPTGNIKIDRIKTVVGGEAASYHIIPQEGYEITKVMLAGDDITSNFKQGGDLSIEKVASNEQNTVEGVGPLIIEVEKTSSDDPAPAASYTVAPKAAQTEAHVGDNFTVDVAVSADQADAGLAAVDAVLDYDSTLVKPISVTMADAFNQGTEDLGLNGTIKGYGDGVTVGEDGVTVATYTFQALKAGDAEFSIADGAVVGTSGSAADIAAASGDKVTVTLKEKPLDMELISNDTYKAAPQGKQLLKLKAENLPSDGQAYFYGEETTPLVYAGEADGKQIFLGFVDASVTTDTLDTVTEKAADSYLSVKYDGDVNLNGTVNAIDALVTYDLSKQHPNYLNDADFTNLSAQSRLEADVNKDGTVTAADARAVLVKSLGL